MKKKQEQDMNKKEKKPLVSSPKSLRDHLTEEQEQEQEFLRKEEVERNLVK